MNKDETLEFESTCDTVIHGVSDWAEGIATDAEIQALHDAWRVISDRVQAHEWVEEPVKQIALQDFDRTKHVVLNGDPTDARDLIVIEWISGKDDDNHEQHYVQVWHLVFASPSFDRSEVESIVRQHFYHFQECGPYQNASIDGAGIITVTGGLDI